MAEIFWQDAGGRQRSQVGNGELWKKREHGGESGRRLAKECDAHVVHVAPLLMLGNGLRDDRRQLIFREHTEHLRLGKIWIRKRVIDDHRLAIVTECSGTT